MSFQERIYKVILAPIQSEKSAIAVELSNQYGFKVMVDATKEEIKAAIEKLYEVNVVGVQTLNVKGKTKRTRHGLGKRNDWKKAYVRVQEGQEIDLQVAE
ncbi:50S ribosomal protein L23 [Sessilibacter corallicola]|uniref:Large ribosomal subunit protein uL23 n=1 Tax=Sessilibacter corallicola TaxID=2904075 RepID=A0ABQ0AE15_9GAMM|nr:50S ribosomal protein L23 [Sessilibacter corallicola]MCE2027391.1 50S ribosomal protein L23 [Sessilibacter corallicola]